MRNKARLIATGIIGGGGGGITFPYDFDPTGLTAFPAGWTGSSTFVISSDVISNTPATGANLCADPGLEGAYTDGANGSLIITGGTATEVTSGVHGGSKAQGWDSADGTNILDIKTPEAKEWYKMSGWLKRTAGEAGNIFAQLIQSLGGIDGKSRMLSSADYVQLGGVCYTATTDNLFAYFAAGGTDDIVLDDVGIWKLTKTSLYKLVNAAAGYTAKIKVTTWDTNSFIGVVSHSDGTLDNCLIAYYAVPASNAYTYCVLDKIVAGVRTNLVGTWSNQATEGGGGTPTSSQWLEIRYTDTGKVTLYHNDIAVGAEQSIPAELLANTYYGIVDAGGNSVNRFFVGSQTAVSIGAAGSSNTYSATGYFQKLYNVERPQYLVTKLDASANGQGITTYTLANYANLAGSVQVVADTTGDNTNPDHLYGVEAFIRKCHADGYKLLIAALPVWSSVANDQVNTPSNQTVLELIISLLDHYGVTYFDMWDYCKTYVGNGGDLSDLFGDQYHPTDAGHLAIAAGLAPYYVTGGTIPTPLAARVYPESEALE